MNSVITASDIKLTWHPRAERWCKVIGKRRSQDCTRLVQAQWYFTANREDSEKLALARKVEWKQLKKSWSQSHQRYLELLQAPFSDLPHWYKSKRRVPTEEEIEAVRHQIENPSQSDIAEDHRDMTVNECAGFFLMERKAHEGIDFKATSNKSFESDLRGALAAIDKTIEMVELLPADVERMRLKLLTSCASKNTARNYGRAFQMMLDWYYGSPFFYGGTKPQGFAAVFKKFPKKKGAKAKHLSESTLKTLFATATPRRRKYMLLMLNTGMQPTDIPAVPASGVDLPGRVVKWKRKKNDRLLDENVYEVESTLWSETAEAVRPFLARDGFAFRNQRGEPLYRQTKSRNRNNAVTKSLSKFFERFERLHGVKVTAKNLRQTGAQFVHEASGSYEVSRVWLGREFKVEDKSYLAELHSRANAAGAMVRKRLVAAGVLTTWKR